MYDSMHLLVYIWSVRSLLSSTNIEAVDNTKETTQNKNIITIISTFHFTTELKR